MINSLDNGGLNMIDFKSFCISMKAVWATRMYENTKATWTIIRQKYFEKRDFVTLLCMNTETEKQIPIRLPDFYRDVLNS